jgi:hypothetical protein
MIFSSNKIKEKIEKYEYIENLFEKYFYKKEKENINDEDILTLIRLIYEFKMKKKSQSKL